MAESAILEMKHFDQLDGLRAVVIALVLITHLWDPKSHLGQIGVILFFTISWFSDY